MLTVAERPLDAAETKALAERLKNMRQEGRSTLVKNGGLALLICAVLAALSYARSDEPPWVIVLFWSVIGVFFMLWMGMPSKRNVSQTIRSLEDATRANKIRTTRIQSSRVVEFDIEDPGAGCYAFEADATTCVFVVGRTFHPAADFPNSEFSISDILDTHGRPVDTTLTKSGHTLKPERVVPTPVMRLVEIPEHLSTVEAEIGLVEHALAKPKGRGYA